MEKRVRNHSDQPFLCSPGSQKLLVFTTFVFGLSVAFSLVSNTMAFSFAKISKLWVVNLHVRNLPSVSAHSGLWMKEHSSQGGRGRVQTPSLRQVMILFELPHF